MMGQLPHPEDDGFVLGYSAGVVWLACVFLTSPREKKNCTWVLWGGEQTCTAVKSSEL